MAKFLISILGLNRVDFSRQCIDSVFANSKDFRLVLTNNASTDGTAEYFDSIKEAHPEIVTVIHEPSNTGFIPPNNRAFQMAADENIPYFIALNNDTKVPAGWLEKLAEPLDSHPMAAVSGPAGGCCSLHPNMHGWGGPRFEYVEGACLCAKVSAVRAIGPSLFSDYLTMIYGDDSDLSLRVQEQDYTIHRVKFTLEHSRGETVLRQPEVRKACQAAQEKNHQVLTRRWRHYLKVRKHDYPIVLKRSIAIGDVLLVSALIRTIRKSNPLSPIHVQTEFPQVFDYNLSVRSANRRIKPDQTAMVIDLDMAYENRPNTHIVDAYAAVAREQLVALPAVERRTEIFFSERDMTKAAQMLPKGERICAIHCTPTTWKGKNWPEDRWGHLIDWLHNTGWEVVWVGNGHRSRHWRHGTDLINRTNLHQLAAVLKQCNLFIGHCSAPLHVAQAVGTPVIGLFGVTSSKYILTDGSPSIGVDANPNIPSAGSRHRTKGATFVPGGEDAMLSIIPEMVYDAVERAVI